MSSTRTPIGRWLDLSARTAIVTGGGSGIGRAIARRLAEAGADVVVADVDDEGAATTVRTIESDGGRAVAQHADVRVAASASDTARRAVTEFGRLDILVNNAGLYPRSDVLNTSEALWDAVLDVNLKGTFLFSKECASAMVDSGHGGTIINIASKQAVRGGSGLAHYAASKAGVVLFTQSLAIELGPSDIRVNAVAPGPVLPEADDDGPIAAGATGTDVRSEESAAELYLRRIPLGRFSEPDDIARVVVFLATDAAAMMTGSLVVVDGGAVLT